MTRERKRMLKQHERTVARLSRLVKKWVGQLWLGQWDVRTTWEWNGISDRQNAAATCTADWQYMHARIRFDVPYCSTLPPDELEVVVVHELLHAVVNEMQKRGISHEERVVSHLERIVVHMARRGRKCRRR